MQAELGKLIKQFEGALEHVNRISASCTEEEWVRRPTSGGWSAAECVAHLNLTALPYRNIFPNAIDEAKRIGGGAPGRLRKDLVGWLIFQAVKPNGRVKSKAAAAFVPASARTKSELLAEFIDLQNENIAAVRRCEGLPIHKVKVVSPIDERAKYSVYSALCILAAHNERHLIQAERALEKPAA